MLWRVGLLALLPGLLAGCVGDMRSGGSSWHERFRHLDICHHPNMIHLHLAVIEQPLADQFLNDELWQHVAPVVKIESKLLLERNGFRVGQVVGPLPGELRELLKSERSCINPRQRLVAAGSSVALLLGPILPRCRYQIAPGGECRDIELIDGQCALWVTPTFTPERQVRLHFTPRVEHGKIQPEIRVAPDRSDFVMEVERPHQMHPELAWEVTLGPNQWLVVGCLLDRPGSLGFRSFVEEEAANGPVQRLLVLRAFSAGNGLGADPDLSASDGTATGAVPLALQAIQREYRASSQ